MQVRQLDSVSYGCSMQSQRLSNFRDTPEVTEVLHLDNRISTNFL